MCNRIIALLEFISEPITVGGARGVSAAINFAAGPLIRLHKLNYNYILSDHCSVHRVSTRFASKRLVLMRRTLRRMRELFSLLETIHDNTVNYFENRNISGIQVWPDLSRWNDVNPNSYFSGT